ncbi:MAG: oligoribonuclease [Deltaproteobacteria bacterium]|nr:oligoribonuclease [Deltaproteobacteria bacterium]
MQYLIWADLEMTGLDPVKDKILEIATIVTDKNLEIIEIGPELVIHHEDQVLDNMNDWCVKQHGKSGLTHKARNSDVTVEQAQEQTLSFIKNFVKEQTAPLCGNSIHQDRRFLEQYMPDINNYLHYRNIDVTAIKILFEMWYPQLDPFKKKENHTAMDDIIESIEELKFYRKTIFKNGQTAL